MENGSKIIACRIFEHELNSLLSSDADIDIHWLDAALHADQVRMKKELLIPVENTPGESGHEFVFLFGNGCHPDICGITEGCGGRVLPVKNCIQALVGPEKTEQLEANRTMVITPGWITAWPGIMEGLGWDAVDVRINLGRYDRILLLDPGIVPIRDEEILDYYDLVQVPIEIEPIDLSYFHDLISRMIPGAVK